MTTELFVLILVALLAATMWVPFIVGVNVSPAGNTDFTRPLAPSVHPPRVHRAYRAHLNLLEQGMPFAVVVLILHMVGGETALTATAAVAFLLLRIAHAVGMITGLAGFPLRPVIYSAGWVCILILGYAALTA